MALTQRYRTPKDEGVCTVENFDFILRVFSIFEILIQAECLAQHPADYRLSCRVGNAPGELRGSLPILAR